jgi:hypothetical protein
VVKEIYMQFIMESFQILYITVPNPAARGLGHGSAADRLLGSRVRIPPEHRYLPLVSVVCCQVEVSASSRSLVQRSPTDCGVSVCDRESSTLRRLWPTGGCFSMEKDVMQCKNTLNNMDITFS